MAALPFMKFFPEAWRQNVRRLSLPARGCYIELLAEMWINNKPYLINEPDVLARVVGVSQEEFLTCWQEIQRNGFEMFSVTQDGKMLYQRRLMKEWNDAQEKSEKARYATSCREFKKQDDVSDDTSDDISNDTSDDSAVDATEVKIGKEVKILRLKDTKDIKSIRGVEGETTLPAAANEKIPYQQIVDLYNNLLTPDLPEVKTIQDKRKKLMSARWNQKAEYRTLDFWDSFFHKVMESNHLMGKTPPAKGYDNPFRATFDWLLDPNNFVKVNENNYTKRTFKNKYAQTSDRDPDEILQEFHEGFSGE